MEFRGCAINELSVWLQKRQIRTSNYLKRNKLDSGTRQSFKHEYWGCRIWWLYRVYRPIDWRNLKSISNHFSKHILGLPRIWMSIGRRPWLCPVLPLMGRIWYLKSSLKRFLLIELTQPVRVGYWLDQLIRILHSY